jgi:uncharacterized protein YacL
MRMPLSDFLLNGDLKFIIILYIFLILAVVLFVKKLKTKENQDYYNSKINKLGNWSLLLAVFSLLLGMLHSFYFISKTKGIATSLLFGGLSNMLITPTLGVVIAIVVKLLGTPLKKIEK